ncbi:MAG: hypothetical protein AVDCRST_MAG64-2463 [uncultured Phycisphaerae bacterium]|uniref:Uncharacterized protein n=1 Tax=uncultured Phycisphaerae bacterium TaxID=904963 RepID=A0A6J4PGZ2_9BACT|nr:MAG: hypothetical protein AVDCRST_MAG64-2463 [uncultured Phycisphaerae bacterium]
MSCRGRRRGGGCGGHILARGKAADCSEGRESTHLGATRCGSWASRRRLA